MLKNRAKKEKYNYENNSFLQHKAHFGVELETFFGKVYTSECRCRISIEISTLKERKKNIMYILQKKKKKNEKDNIATSTCDTRSSAVNCVKRK